MAEYTDLEITKSLIEQTTNLALALAQLANDVNLLAQEVTNLRIQVDSLEAELANFRPIA